MHDLPECYLVEQVSTPGKARPQLPDIINWSVALPVLFRLSATLVLISEGGGQCSIRPSLHPMLQKDLAGRHYYGSAEGTRDKSTAGTLTLLSTRLDRESCLPTGISLLRPPPVNFLPAIPDPSPSLRLSTLVPSSFCSPLLCDGPTPRYTATKLYCTFFAVNREIFILNNVGRKQQLCLTLHSCEMKVARLFKNSYSILVSCVHRLNEIL